MLAGVAEDALDTAQDRHRRNGNFTASLQKDSTVQR